MESSISDAADQSVEYSGSDTRHVMELEEEHPPGFDNVDAGSENVGHTSAADVNADSMVEPIKDTKDTTEQPDSVILDELDTQNGSLEETMMSNGEDLQMGKAPQPESSSVILDDNSSHNCSRSWSLGFGFEMGDMVWGKVKSHPWWPGHIFNEGFASSSVRRTKKDGHVLVAFFGDGSYGWFDPAELIPYEPHFAEKSKQSTSRHFVKAVDESVDESCRRSALGLTCFCRNPYNFRPTNVPRHVAVDVLEFEAGGIYSDNQIQKARDNFQPERFLSFIEQLAAAPREATMSLDFGRHKTSTLAYRRAVFEEFDETYAQAFGQKGARPISAPPPSVDQSVQAQLSGPLVIAESLSGHKSSTKSVKLKEHNKRDRYLLKRRDESGDTGFPQIGQGHSSSSSSAASQVQPSHAAAGEYILQKRDQAVDQQEVATPAKDEPATLSLEPSKEVELTGLSTVQEQSDPKTVKSKKAGVLKKALKRSDTEKPELGEKKRKKRRSTDSPGRSDHLAKHSSVGQVGSPSQIDSQLKGVSMGSASEQVPAGSSGVAAMSTEENASELKQVLADLKVLALNPSYGRERNRPAIARQIFLRFRSLVFQKSLNSSDSDASEIRSSKTPSGETTRSAPPSRPPKALGRTDDPTKGGKKRPPSERQEDLAVKRVKKVTAIKSAASAEKTKAGPETLHSDGKAKGHVAAPQRAGPKVDPGMKMQPPKARVEEPTLLVMKYPSGTSIPSSAELKARFARFGPMDTSQNRVFYTTNTCRICYLFKEDAENAYKFAVRNKSAFANVRFTLRPHTDSQVGEKPGRDTSRAGDDILVDHAQPTSPVMLKSCLKKSAGDEGKNNPSSRGARVRFNMVEPTSSGPVGAGFQVKDPRNDTSISSLSEARSGSSSLSVAMDSHNNQQKVFSTLPLQPPLVSRNNPTHAEVPSRSHSQNYNYTTTMLPPPPPPQPSQPPPTDISQQMLTLLTRCNDVVTNVKSILGYVPYHPL